MKTLLCVSLIFALLMLGIVTASAQSNPQIPLPNDATDLTTLPGTVTYSTSLSADAVADLYTNYLTSVGFSVTMNLFVTGTDAGGTIGYAGPGGRSMTIIVGSDEGVTSVLVNYSGDFAPITGTVNVTTDTNAEGGESTATEYVPVETPLNIELVFDASGSMADAIGSETRIEAARQTVDYIAESLPDDANVRVGMRVFGQAGDNSDAGRGESCASTELLVPVQSSTDSALVAAAEAYEPTGWTPIALALNQAAMDFNPDFAAGARNVIILVSDGEETCGGDPAAVAQLLYNSDAQITTHVVTLGATEESAPVMSAISANGGGVYLNANESVELSGGVIGLISSEVSNSGGTLVLPEPVAAALSVQGANGTITVSNGQINISALAVPSAVIGQVSIDGSLGRLNLNAGGSAVSVDAISNIVSFETDQGTVTLSGDDNTITLDGENGGCTLSLTSINCSPVPTTPNDGEGE